MAVYPVPTAKSSMPSVSIQWRPNQPTKNTSRPWRIASRASSPISKVCCPADGAKAQEAPCPDLMMTPQKTMTPLPHIPLSPSLLRRPPNHLHHYPLHKHPIQSHHQHPTHTAAHTLMATHSHNSFQAHPSPPPISLATTRDPQKKITLQKTTRWRSCLS